METEKINLLKMPMLEALLKNYVLFMYEDSANTSQESLEMEYYYLKKENRLSELFVQELLDNSWQDFYEG
jgi:hypothetical protein